MLLKSFLIMKIISATVNNIFSPVKIIYSTIENLPASVPKLLATVKNIRQRWYYKNRLRLIL